MSEIRHTVRHADQNIDVGTALLQYRGDPLIDLFGQSTLVSVCEGH